MTNPVDEWLTTPAPPADATTERLIKHDRGWHDDDPDDECPACRVDRGIALLDERRPGWWEDVDVLRLHLRDGCQCVLGQVYGDYFVGIEVVFCDDLDVIPNDYGFDGDDARDYAILTAIWRRRISERRAR